MTGPLGASDLFLLEAGEALDQLAALTRQESPPPADEFVRAARLLRGSAVMARQQPIAGAAAALEVLARAGREQGLDWKPALREELVQAVEEFRALVRRTPAWTEVDSARATGLARRLEALAGESPPRRRDPSSPPGADPPAGMLTFVAREAALIATALDHASLALAEESGDREALFAVIRRTQSLRGLAELGEFSPLPEILDAVELVVGDLTRAFDSPPGVRDVLAAASGALTRAARDVAGRGTADPDSAEARQFTDRLLRTFAVERDVVPIESLYADGDPDPVIRPAAQPQFDPPEPPGPLELVSQGEHLCQSADLIVRSGSTIERDLRLYRLLGALRSAATPGPDPVAGALTVFARSAREALASGVGSRAADDLIGALRQAGELLRGAAETDDRMLLSRRLLDTAYRIDQLRAAVPDSDVVPIESLAPDAPTPASRAPAGDEGLPIVPIASLTPDGPAHPLETGWDRYRQLLRERGAVAPSLDALLGAEGRPAPGDRLPETRPGRAPAGPAPSLEDPPVEVTALCYRGRAALERADEVGRQLARELALDRGPDAIHSLLQELLDLVPLALIES